jgi:hypothetical protein
MVDRGHQGRRFPGRSGQIALTFVLIAILVCPQAGCSFLFVQRPPSAAEGHRGVAGGCTSSSVAPVLDGLVTALQVVRTVAAAGATDAQYMGAPISRGADISIGFALTMLFGASAIAGFTWTADCREALGEDTSPASRPGPRKPGWTLGPPSPSQRKLEEQQEEAAVQARSAERARAAREAAQGSAGADAGAPGVFVPATAPAVPQRNDSP